MKYVIEMRMSLVGSKSAVFKQNLEVYGLVLGVEGYKNDFR